MALNGGAYSPRVRSISMNGCMNGNSWYTAQIGNYFTFRKTTEVLRPAPSLAFVFLDEHPESIDDGYFLVYVDRTALWANMPANYHNGACGFSFADGHAEIRKWRDPDTWPRTSSLPATLWAPSMSLGCNCALRLPKTPARNTRLEAGLNFGLALPDIHMGAPRTNPAKAELLAAATNTVPDVIAPGLRVLFCGINPGLYSAWARHHFARPGNRFWPALYAGGFTPRFLRPEEEHELLRLGYGITNLVERATLGSADLSTAELRAGGRRFVKKVIQYAPKAVAILGVSAYRSAFGRSEAKVGRQQELIGNSVVWVLPNPSGLNAHFTPKVLAKVFRECRLQLTCD